MKTLLINPPLSLEQRYGRKLKGFGAVTEPLGLAYLAGSIEAAGFPVRIADAPAEDLDTEALAAQVAQERPDLVGITFLTPMFEAVRSLAEAVKRASPTTRIAVGGPHPTALPEETLAEIPSIDFACIGEGEVTGVEIVRHLRGELALPSVAGLAYRDGSGIVRSPAQPFRAELDTLPKPARHLLPMSRYRLTASRTSGSSYCPTIIVARGCPFHCTYCSHPFGRTWRHHSVDRIVEEIRDVTRNYGVDQVNLEADTLTLDRRFLLALCDRLVAEKLGVRWTCESRIDTVDGEMLARMKKAGCWQISYGVETGSQRLMELIAKGTKKEKVRETFALTRQAGITARGFFMLGIPTETPDESAETIRFALELDPLWAQFTITIPYPGTAMFTELEAQGKLRHRSWSEYNTWGGWAEKRLPYVSEGRTEEELKRLQKRALVLFYLRPSVLLRFARSIRSLADLAKYAKGFLTLLGTSRETKCVPRKSAAA